MKFLESLVADRTTTRSFFRILAFVVTLPLLILAGLSIVVWNVTGQIVITLLALGNFAITGEEDFQWFWNWSN